MQPLLPCKSNMYYIL